MLKIKSEFLELAKEYKEYIDSDTRLSLKSEEQFSVIFKKLFQNNKIDFNKINLYNFDSKELLISDKTMGSIVESNASIENEFLLKSDTQEGISEWGNMRIDISITTEESIVFIENKIGSPFTYRGKRKEYSTQMRRYLNYLKNIKNIDNENKILILLSSKLFFDKKWYFDSYLKSIDDANTDIDCYCICWEEIFEATV